jgi:hypothetical protein
MDMAKFVIEGTVSELEVSGNKYIFKLHGTEGFSVKRGEKKYNIFWGNEDKLSVLSYMRLTEEKYEAFEHQGGLLTASITGGKRVRITIDSTKEQNSSIEESKVLEVSTISLLAD